LEAEQVDAAAGGRVWSGETALDLGLVDELGEIEQAIESAAYLASLGEDYDVFAVEDPKWAQLGLMQRLLNIMAVEQKQAFPALAQVENWLQTHLPVWILQPDRQNIYSHCLECSLVSE